MSTCGPCTDVGCDRDDSGNNRQISAINLNGRERKKRDTLMRLIRFLVLGRRGMSRVCLRCAYNGVLFTLRIYTHTAQQQVIAMHESIGTCEDWAEKRNTRWRYGQCVRFQLEMMTTKKWNFTLEWCWTCYEAAALPPPASHYLAKNIIFTEFQDRWEILSKYENQPISSMASGQRSAQKRK